MEAVAAGDEVGGEAMGAAVDGVGELGGGAVGRADLDVGGVEHQRQPGRRACVDEVGDDLGLPVDECVAPGQPVEVEVVGVAIEPEVETVVAQRLRVQATGDAEFGQGVDGGLFDHTGANPGAHVRLVARLEDDDVDTLAVQHHRQRQTRRAGTDDRDLTNA